MFDNGKPYEAVVKYAGGTRTLPLTKQAPIATIPADQADADQNDEDVLNNQDDGTPETTLQTVQNNATEGTQNQVQQIIENPIPLAGGTETQSGGDELKSAFSPAWLLLLLIPAAVIIWFFILAERRRQENEGQSAAR